MRVLKAKIYGKVQGVWFRKYTYNFAKNIGLVGMVKNLDDGTVLVHAVGINLGEFKKHLKIGPPGSAPRRSIGRTVFKDMRLAIRVFDLWLTLTPMRPPSMRCGRVHRPFFLNGIGR